MSNVGPSPCPEWKAVLPLTHPSDLLPEQRAALEAHLATCSACAAERASYERMDQAIQRVPTARPLPAFPAELQHLLGEQHSSAPPTRRQQRAMLPARYIQGEPPMFARRARGIAAIAAVAVVVALFVLLFQNFAGGHHTVSSTQPQPTATTTPQSSPQPAGAWTILPGLSNETTLPMIAPSNPSIVYEAGTAFDGSGAITLRRSDDAGATWHNLPVPPDTLPVDEMSIGVSPISASTVLLSLTTSLNDHPSLCPASSAVFRAQVSLSGSAGCSLQYLSTDSGQHWSLIHLPIQGALGAPFFADESFGNSDTILRAQEQRLYSALGKENVSGFAGGTNGLRLVRSDDGGKDWQLIDAALVAGGQNICDYMPTSTGSTIYAITQSGQFCYDNGQDTSALWRSDDAGATWTLVQQFPKMSSHLTLVNQINGTEPLIYLHMPAIAYNAPQPTNNSLSNIQVSADGGKTWKQAPSHGLPSNTSQSYGPFGVLSDGSIVAAFKTPDQFLTLASWKSGSAAWRFLAGQINASFDYWLVTQNNGTSSIWLVSHFSQNYTVQRFDVQ